MALNRVISGGQTGVDQAAWRSARLLGLQTGGAMPREFQTEEGPRPDLAAQFGAKALESEVLEDRTRANVAGSDATLILVGVGNGIDRGTKATLELCRALGKPHRLVTLSTGNDVPTTVADILAWLEREHVAVLNVAGPRESWEPGIAARAEALLERVFQAVS
jgi:hypothetical protein